MIVGSSPVDAARFQALREKYELVIQTQTQHQRELEVARGRMKGLQDEIDMLLDAFIEMAHASPILRLDEPPPPHPTREELARDAARRQAMAPMDLPPPGGIPHNGDPALYAQHPLGPNANAQPPPPPIPVSQPAYTNGTATNGKRKRRRVAQEDADPEEAARRSSNMAFITEIIQPHPHER
ncbi:hypothetical protein V5O48_009953 [Marasmius crinis-equi]|uniref:Uncharacterized protein n=1 Tax=Marasmius crinis-equi TaxID=585013 RepID=A0ABR3F9R6_9AGAR